VILLLRDLKKLQKSNHLRKENIKLMKLKVLKVPRKLNWSAMIMNQLEIKSQLINTSHLHLPKNRRWTHQKIQLFQKLADIT
jgi:hypothetical protein